MSMITMVIYRKFMASVVGPLWCLNVSGLKEETLYMGWVGGIFSVSCNFIYTSHVSINDEAAVMHLYRIAKEAVTNAVKHSSPDHIEISLSRNNGCVKLTIKDDGTGIRETKKDKNGMGLNIMNYRASMIGASLDILSETSRGTSVVCTYTENGNRSG